MGYGGETLCSGSGFRRFGYRSSRSDIEYGGYADCGILSDTLCDERLADRYFLCGYTGLTLTADVAKDVNFTTGARKASFPVLDGNLNFMDQSGTLVTQLQAGESYGTTLNFDIDSFTLEGEEKEWGDGGKMTIPVVVPEPVP